MIFFILTLTHLFVDTLHTPIANVQVMIINKMIQDCFDVAIVHTFLVYLLKQ